MEGRTCPEGMTREQFDEAERLFQETEQATADEMWRICCMMAGKRDHELFGETEFQLRDMIHRIGAVTLEKAADARRKKGAT